MKILKVDARKVHIKFQHIRLYGGVKLQKGSSIAILMSKFRTFFSVAMGFFIIYSLELRFHYYMKNIKHVIVTYLFIYIYIYFHVRSSVCIKNIMSQADKTRIHKLISFILDM